MKWLFCFCFMLLTSQQIDKYLEQYDDGKITAKQFVEYVRDWRIMDSKPDYSNTRIVTDPCIVSEVTNDYKKQKSWRTFEDCAKEAAKQTNKELIDEEASLWFGMISSGLITFDEFKSLIRGKKDLEEMRELRMSK